MGKFFEFWWLCCCRLYHQKSPKSAIDLSSAWASVDFTPRWWGTPLTLQPSPWPMHSFCKLNTTDICKQLRQQRTLVSICHMLVTNRQTARRLLFSWSRLNPAGFYVKGLHYNLLRCCVRIVLVRWTFAILHMCHLIFHSCWIQFLAKHARPIDCIRRRPCFEVREVGPFRQCGLNSPVRDARPLSSASYISRWGLPRPWLDRLFPQPECSFLIISHHFSRARTGLWEPDRFAFADANGSLKKRLPGILIPTASIHCSSRKRSEISFQALSLCSLFSAQSLPFRRCGLLTETVVQTFRWMTKMQSWNLHQTGGVEFPRANGEKKTDSWVAETMRYGLWIYVLETCKLASI